MKIEKRARRFYNSEKIKRAKRYNDQKVKAHVIDKIKFIKKNIRLNKKTKVLEVGAGGGYFSYYLNKYCDLLVSDVNKEVLSLNPVKKKKICDASNLPFKNNAFNVVFSFDVLHHIDNPQEALGEMKRVSKGYVVMIEPNGDNLFQRIIISFFPREWGAFRFTTKYFKNLIKESKLKIIKFKHIGRLMSPNNPLSLDLLEKIPYTNSSQLNLSNIAICKK